MATNVIHNHGDHISIAVTHPATPSSGDPVRIGDMCGIALTDESGGGNATGETTVKLNGVVDVSVKGVDGVGNSAVAVGDSIYYVDADTPVLSKKTSGKLFGFALEAVTSGATSTIRVKLAR